VHVPHITSLDLRDDKCI